jgi:hypothetical protein
MGAALQFTVSMETLTCGECGIEFAVPLGWLNARRGSKEAEGKFWCPNGHGRQFRESELERTKRELAAAKEKAEREERWRHEAEKNAKNARAQAKAERTRRENLAKRVAAGVCPCCHRTFQQLARHMAAKHPGVAPPANVESAKAEAAARGEK